MRRLRVARRKVKLTVHRRKIQRAKPQHKQTSVAQCGECPFIAADNRGLAAHKRFRHSAVTDTGKGKKQKPNLKFGGGDGSGGGAGVLSHPKPLWDVDGLIATKQALIKEIEKDIMKLRDIRDELNRIAKN